MHRRHLLVLTVATAALLPLGALAQDRLPVVATFSILGDMVAEVGGDRIALTTLVGPDGDGHVYQPTPADAQAVAGAALVVVNGAQFEGWIDRLIAAAEYAGPVAVATEGIALAAAGAAEDADDAHAGHDDEEHGEEAGHDAHGHDAHGHDEEAGHDEHDHADHAEDDHAGHDHGETDPHAWQSLDHARVYVANISAALSAADPAGAEVYAANTADYLARIDALDVELGALMAALPEGNRNVVTSHDSFGYLAARHNLRIIAPQGLSTESEASAADVARLIDLIRDEGVKAVFIENIADPRLIEQIGAETGVAVGGALYSDALSGPDGPASTYLAMMRHNALTIAAALAP